MIELATGREAVPDHENPMQTTNQGVMGILQRDFILGEKKYLKFQATSCDDEPFWIGKATYKLLDEDENVVDSGVCTVEGTMFKVLIEPPARGEYTLEVEYIIYPEVRKVKVFISVA